MLVAFPEPIKIILNQTNAEPVDIIIIISVELYVHIGNKLQYVEFITIYEILNIKLPVRLFCAYFVYSSNICTYHFICLYIYYHSIHQLIVTGYVWSFHFIIMVTIFSFDGLTIYQINDCLIIMFLSYNGWLNMWLKLICTGVGTSTLVYNLLKSNLCLKNVLICVMKHLCILLCFSIPDKNIQLHAHDSWSVKFNQLMISFLITMELHRSYTLTNNFSMKVCVSNWSN